MRCPAPVVAIGWAGALHSQRGGSLVGWGCSRTHGMSGRKGLRSPEFRFSLCCKFALQELLRLPLHGLVCILHLRPTPGRGYLWLMGNAAILCSLIQTFQSPAGDRVMSSSLCFGNTYFTNMKYMDICACSIPDPARCMDLYTFAFSSIASFSVA